MWCSPDTSIATSALRRRTRRVSLIRNRAFASSLSARGGARLHPYTEPTLPNSEARNHDSHGVLKLALHPDGYEWEFTPIAGKTFNDTGRGTCH